MMADEALHPLTNDLVDRFALALKEKLLASQIKYGWADDWARDDWQERCQASLLDHIGKGDPRDVAAFAAFMWHHDWPTATRPASKADSALVGELREKAEQADAAKRNLHGLPVLAMESDTHKGKLALWCDNGLAGVGQTCVAVNLGEFPDEQIKAIAALANIAATTDFAAILAALSDRDVVLEEAAKKIDQRASYHGDQDQGPRRQAAWKEARECAATIRALKGGVDG
ncbi:MAG: hypothetical protein ABJF09_00645 [Qipengyuania citrea]